MKEPLSRQSKHATQGRMKKRLIKKKGNFGSSYFVVPPCDVLVFNQHSYAAYALRALLYDP